MVIEQSSHAGLTAPEISSAGKQQCRNQQCRKTAVPESAVPENSSAGISSAGNGQGQTALPGRCARA
jgi:hypothetical protein